MSFRKLKVGDRVHTYLGDATVIVAPRDWDNLVGLKVDGLTTGHSLQGSLPNSTQGWWVTKEECIYIGRESPPEPEGKYSKIIAKIKYLDDKFKERKLNELPF